MSKNRPRRNIDRVDYKIYNKTGNKIVKNRKGISIMASSVDQELKVVGRLERFMIEYDFSLLYEVVDIEEGIREVRNIVESYEELHLKLKLELGILSYEETYPEYEDRIKCVTNWIRSAKSEIRNKKSLANKQERVDLIEKQKTLIRAEEKYFSKRIKAEVISMTSEKSIFVDDLKKNVSVEYV